MALVECWQAVVIQMIRRCSGRTAKVSQLGGVGPFGAFALLSEHSYTRSSDGRAYCSCSTMPPPSPQPLASAWLGVALRKRGRGAVVALSKQ